MYWNAFLLSRLRLFFLIACSCVFAHSQASNPDWLFFTRAYQVNAIIADSLYVWVGGYSGLARVDRASGAQEFYNPSNSALPSYRIDCIDRAADGTFWIGTDNGLAVWNGVTWTIYDQQNAPILNGQIIAAVLADTAGSGWVAQEWLHWYDGIQWTTFDTTNSPLQPWQARRLYKALDGQLVVGCSSGDLFFYNGSNWNVINPADSGFNSSLVQAIGQASDSSLWFSNAYGLYHYLNGSYAFYDNLNSPMPNQHVEALRVDANDVVWMAVSEYFGPACSPCSGGLQSFDGTQWMKYDTSNSDMPPLSQLALDLDESGRPWVGGTDGAIANLDAGIVYPLEVKNSGLTHPSIATLLVHPDGKAFTGGGYADPFQYPGDLVLFDGVQWTGTEGHFSNNPLATAIGPGAELYIKRRDNLHRLINGVWDTLPWPLSGATIYYTDLHEMKIDRANNIWTDVVAYVTTPGGSPVFHEGVARFDGANWTVWCDTNSALPDRPVEHLFIDRNDAVWMVSLGLWRYDGTSWIQPPQPPGLNGNSRLAEDSSGGIWVSLDDFGLARFDGTSWTTYPNPLGFGTGTYQDLAVAADQSVWAASYSHVARFDGSNWQLFDAANSPLDVNCTAVEADKYGNVWFGYPVGLFAYRDGGVVLDAPELPAERPFRIHYHAGSKHLSLTWDDDYLPVSAQVISPEGKTITIACPRNDQGFRLDFSRLAAGSYVLRLIDRNGLPRIARFVVL